MSDIAERILKVLSTRECVNSYSLASEWGLDHQKVVGGVKSLEALEDYATSEPVTEKSFVLTEEGEKVVKKGSHEFLAYSAVPPEGIPTDKLIATFGNVGFSKAMSSGWITLDKSQPQNILVKKKASGVVDSVQNALKHLDDLDCKLANEFKKRKLLSEIVIKSYNLRKGPGFSLKLKRKETDLTPEMILSGSWKNADFKPYNFDALGIQPETGHLHPLLKVRSEYRQIFLEMGFTEMPTNNFVESSFWNFDALFQPQQHPARDAHDTFFISDPAEASDFPQDYLNNVKKVHMEGGFGSRGYGYDWSISEARKNLLRTHTTAVSARMLYKLMNDGDGKFSPQKYFSIDRVFRNETLDATHLAEFHQIEGVIADRGLTLGDLIGILYEFFKKLGIEKLRFKPAYNPYTEPSMEIFSYHEGLKKWVEIGNSGVFRPEMLLPMGIPDDVNVIAWGLSLERPTMIKYGIDNIRDLCGHKINLKMVEKNPICRLDKDSRGPLPHLVQVLNHRWTGIEEKLRFVINKYSIDLRSSPISDNEGKRVLVIYADPNYPPYSTVPLINSLSNKYFLRVTSHAHSDLKCSNMKERIRDLFTFLKNKEVNETYYRSSLDIRIIWKPVGKDPALLVSPGSHSPIKGEANIVRYLSRFGDDPLYASKDAWYRDYFMDLIHGEIVHAKTSALAQRALDCHFKSMKEDIPCALLLWSAIINRRSLLLCQEMQNCLWDNLIKDSFAARFAHDSLCLHNHKFA